MDLFILQTIYFAMAVPFVALSPLLLIQGKIARKRAGKVPEAGGADEGKVEFSADTIRFLAIGESTVAGVGAQTHESALVGRFSEHLGAKINKSVEWQVVGKNGVTAQRCLKELFPRVRGNDFDAVLLGLGGNDVLKLSTPAKWRRDIIKMIDSVRENSPRCVIFITNAPLVAASPVIPHPLKYFLGFLSRLHQKNTLQIVSQMKNVFYFPQPEGVSGDFFCDGIHPSESGYDEWSQSMVNYFSQNHKWTIPTQ